MEPRFKDTFADVLEGAAVGDLRLAEEMPRIAIYVLGKMLLQNEERTIHNRESNMSSVLHLDASPRGERSVSRQLSREFVEAWRPLHPRDCIVYRDVGHEPVPHVTEAWVVGAFSQPESCPSDAQAAMHLSNLLVDEFLTADRYVFGVPMHNLSVPSTFKAYVDQIVRVGRTFSADGKGLVAGKRMVIITARGGSYASGSAIQAMDHQEPWLRAVFGFMGITDITFVHAEGLNLGDELRETGLEYARGQIRELTASW